MLITHHLLFTTEVVSPLELDDHSGAALRGNLFESLWRRFCTNKAAPSCAACPLHSVCPVSALVAPLREENPPGQRDIPRPYIPRDAHQCVSLSRGEENAFLPNTPGETGEKRRTSTRVKAELKKQSRKTWS